MTRQVQLEFSERATIKLKVNNQEEETEQEWDDLAGTVPHTSNHVPELSYSASNTSWKTGHLESFQRTV